MRRPLSVVAVVSVAVLTLGCDSESSGGALPGGAGMAQGGSGANGGGGTVAAGSGNQAGNSSAGAAAAGAPSGGANMGGATNGGTSSGGTSGSGGAATTCDPKNVCDGFEYASGFGMWKQYGTDGTIKVDKTHVFAGNQAMQFVSDAGGNKRVQLERTGAPVFPAMNNVFWGRVMAWAEDLPGMSDMENKNVHYDLIQASGEEPGEYRVAGMGGVLLNYEPHDCYFGTQKPIPQDKWACWEWLFDGEKNVIEFYIDGAQQARVEGKGQGCVDGTSSVWEAPTFNELRIGWVNYQSKAEVTTLWLDELEVGPARIGCPAANPNAH